MSEIRKPICPECEDPTFLENVDRRNFIHVVGGGAATLAAAGGIVLPATLRADEPQAQNPNQRRPRPAEALIRELYNGLSAEQRRDAVYPWNHGGENNQTPSRMRMYNRPMGRRIGEIYTEAQQDLIDRILHSVSSGEEGYRRLTRNNTFDGSRSLQGCGAYFFGDPTTNQWAYVFMGHHLTIRCDGDSVEGAAFGGPIYYGHSPNGYSQRNVFNYQTQSVQSVFEALNEQQRRQAILAGTPGEHAPSVRLQGRDGEMPGISAGDLTAAQRRHVETVMRTILDPYRREDADEVMQIIRRNGGLEQIHLAFYRDRRSNDEARWHFWRLEGPGFVWNFRVLPHVHTYVNISSNI